MRIVNVFIAAYCHDTIYANLNLAFFSFQTAIRLHFGAGAFDREVRVLRRQDVRGLNGLAGETLRVSYGYAIYDISLCIKLIPHTTHHLSVISDSR